MNNQKTPNNDFDTLFRVSKDCMLIVQDELVLDANMTACTFLGYTKEDLVGLSLQELGIELSNEPVSHQLTQCVTKTGKKLEIQIERNSLTGGRELFRIESIGNTHTSSQVVLSQTREVYDLVESVEAGLESMLGEAYFQGLVNQICEQFGASKSFIASLNEEQTHSRTLYFSDKGKTGKNVEYELKGTPCYEVSKGNWCFHPKQVQRLFPEDDILVEWGIEAYVGAPISIREIGKEGAWILVLLFERALKNKSFYKQALKLLAQKIRAEKERFLLLKEIQNQEQRLAQKLMQSKAYQNSILDLSLDKDIILGNIESAFFRITKVVCDTLQASQVGIWFFTEDRTQMYLVNKCYQTAAGELAYSRDIEYMKIAAHPSYFEAIDTDGYIAVYNGQSSKITKSLEKGYLIPNQIKGMLDVGVRTGGVLNGMVCIEQESERAWNTEEITFANTIAALIENVVTTSDYVRLNTAYLKQNKLLEETLDISQQAEEAANFGTLKWKVATNELLVSDNMCRIHGIAPKDFGGRVEEILEFIHPDDLERVNEHTDRMLDAKVGSPIQYRIQTKQGVIKHLEVVYRLIVEDDEVEAVLACLRDITSEKEAAEALEHEIQRKKNILEGTNAGTWEWDIINDEIKVNQRWAEIIGYTVEDFTPMERSDWEATVHPDDLAKAVENLNAHFAGKKEYYEFTFRQKHKEGHWVWVNGRGKITKRDKTGKPLFMAGTHMDITKGKAAAIQLRESEQKFKSVFNALVDMYYEADLDAKFTLLSPSAQIITGYTPNELIGTRLISLYKNPKDRKSLIESLEEKGYAYGFTTVIYNKQGEEVYVESNVKYQRSSTGKVIGVQGVVRDVTKRKKAEEELHRTRELLQETNELAQVGGWELDLVNVKTHWSDMAKRIHEVPLDVDPDDLDPQQFVQDEAYDKEIRKLIKDTMETGKPYDYEFPLITAKGNKKWVRSIGKAEFKDGKCIRLYGSMQDITKRRSLQEELKKANEAEFAKLYQQQKEISAKLTEKSEELTRFFELSIDMICIMKPDTTPVRLNPMFSKTLEYTDEELYSRPLIDLAYTEDIEVTKKIVEDALKGDFIQNFTARLVTKSGEHRWLSWHGVQDPDSQLIYAIARDITEQRELEEDLRRTRAEAVKNAKIKEDFLANMSHEIRTPMNAILGFSQLLTQTSLDKKQRDFVAAINGSAENLLVVINDILDLSKIESGRFELEQIPFDFYKNMDVTTGMLRNNILKKGLDFNVDIDTQIPRYLLGAPNRIAQVLINLLSNASKFTHEGYIQLSAQWLPSKKVRFEVEDTGIGVSEEKLNYIFESFTQAEDYTTRVYGGTGLGLSISQRLVELMGGRIGVESSLDQGSLFYFEIPLAEANEDQKAELTRPQNVYQFSADYPVKLLLVDDNQLNRALVKVHLDQFKCDYDVAINGKEAVDLTQENEYDLVFMDVQMPIMDGLEATRIIRSAQPELPIIAMTAHALQKEKKKCFSAGMNDYLSKPFKKEDLEAILVKYLPESLETRKPNEVELSDTPIIKKDPPSLTLQVSTQKLLNDMGGEQEVVDELLELFAEAVDEFLINMKTALEELDLTKIRKTAHKLKPNCGLFGLPQLQALLEDIEQLVKQGGAVPKIQEMSRTALELMPDLRQQIDELLNE